MLENQTSKRMTFAARGPESLSKTNACDHICRFDGCTNHAQDQVVPIFVNLTSTDVWLQLELEVSTLRIHLVFPLGPDVVAEDHDGIDDMEPIRLFADHTFLLQQLARLRHVVPELPKLLYTRERGHLVSSIGILRCLIA